MTAPPCPRCGEPREPDEACATCGYEPRHPGVLGAFGRAVPALAASPRLALPFLLPAALLFVTGASTLALEADPADALTLAQATADTATAFVTLWWFFVALGLAARGLHGARGGGLLPPGGLVAGSAAAALLAVLPLVVIAGVSVWGPEGPVGALALVAVIVAAIGALVVGGRVVGAPVEAALHERPLAETLRRGLARGRDNGGLGLVFLAFLLFFALALVPVALELAGLALGPWTIVTIGAVLSWPLSAWTGVAMAIALAPQGQEVRTFTCPRCGAEAKASAGRARCSCGVEGPYYPGSG